MDRRAVQRVRRVVIMGPEVLGRRGHFGGAPDVAEPQGIAAGGRRARNVNGLTLLGGVPAAWFGGGFLGGKQQERRRGEDRGEGEQLAKGA